MLRITETVFIRLHKNRENCILQCEKYCSRITLCHRALHFSIMFKIQVLLLSHFPYLSCCHFRARKIGVCFVFFFFFCFGTHLRNPLCNTGCYLCAPCHCLWPKQPQNQEQCGVHGKGKRREGEIVDESVKGIFLLQSWVVVLFKDWCLSCLSATSRLI